MQQGNRYVEVREVGQQGPFGKLCGSICMSFLGVALYWGSLLFLAKNEQSTVCTQRSLIKAAEMYEEVGCDGQELPSGKNVPIFFSCPFTEESMVSRTPKDFGVPWLGEAFKVKAVKVRQDVEMLQCVESKRTEQRKDGDRTIQVDRYSYDLQWRSSWVDSQRFRAWSVNAAHDAMRDGCGEGFRSNPSFKMSGQTLTASKLMAGAFDLTRFLSQVAASEAIPLSDTGSYGAPRRRAKDGQPYTWEEFQDYYDDAAAREWRNAPQASPEGFVEGNVVHTCSSERLGCLRISYFKSSATYGNYVGSRRPGGSPVRTTAWKAPASWMCQATDVDLLSAKEFDQSAEDVLREAERSNWAMTWLCRLLGAAATVLGIVMFLSPIQTMVEIVDSFFQGFHRVPLLGPGLAFLGSAVSGAVGCALLALALALGVPSAMLVVSISWCVMRPLLGVPMLLCSLLGLALGLRKFFRAAKVKVP